MSSDLLDRGISVITAVNLQHIREKQDDVERITGKRAAYSMPEAFLQEADEIEVVDAPPDALIGRGTDGSMPDPRQLAELRELALLLAADVVDRQLQCYLDSHGVAARWGAQERILVCLTPRSNAAEMLRSGPRNATAVSWRAAGGLCGAAGVDPQAIAPAWKAPGSGPRMGAEIHCLQGEDFVTAILDFAREQRITQLFLGHSRATAPLAFQRSPVDRLIEAAETSTCASFLTGRANERGKRGLKIYLGYAAGVGKTYRMLSEAQDMRQKGVDVVIGYFEPHGRKETIAQTEGIEIVPRRKVAYAGSDFEEMDTDAILRRKPAVAIVDEFAHTNVPGANA